MLEFLARNLDGTSLRYKCTEVVNAQVSGPDGGEGGRSVKPVGLAYVGSNPTPATTEQDFGSGVCAADADVVELAGVAEGDGDDGPDLVGADAVVSIGVAVAGAALGRAA